MIVVCPCCNRRYRHDFEGERVATVARCSTCDERFPLASMKRTYRIAGTDSPPPVSIGAGGAGLPMSMRGAPPDEGRVMVGDLPVSTTEATDSLIEIELPSVDGPGAATDLGLETSEVPADESRPEAVPRTRAMLESVVALLPGGVGAVLAYHYAGPLGQDPITWAALGGAIGLLLGWACLLWITRGD